MTNEEYQRLLRSPADELRERLPGEGKGSRTIAKLISDVEDRDLLVAIRDLGGHDLGDLRDAYREADSAHDQPCVIFAYTIKAWRLPTQGHPANHSALLSTEQWRELAGELGADADDPWATLRPTTRPRPSSAATPPRPSGAPRWSGATRRRFRRRSAPPTAARSRPSRASADSSPSWPARRPMSPTTW